MRRLCWTAITHQTEHFRTSLYAMFKKVAFCGGYKNLLLRGLWQILRLSLTIYVTVPSGIMEGGRGVLR